MGGSIIFKAKAHKPMGRIRTDYFRSIHDTIPCSFFKTNTHKPMGAVGSFHRRIRAEYFRSTQDNIIFKTNAHKLMGRIRAEYFRSIQGSICRILVKTNAHKPMRAADLFHRRIRTGYFRRIQDSIPCIFFQNKRAQTDESSRFIPSANSDRVFSEHLTQLNPIDSGKSASCESKHPHDDSTGDSSDLFPINDFENDFLGDLAFLQDDVTNFNTMCQKKSRSPMESLRPSYNWSTS